MKPKLRIIINGLAIGGAERHLSYILPILVQRGYEITVITLSTKDTLANLLQQKGITVHLPKGNFFQNWPSGLRQLCQNIVSMVTIARDLRRDFQAITHFFLPQAYIIGAITALIMHYRGPMIMSRRSLNCYQRKYPLIHRIEKFLHQRMDFILTNSQDALQELQDNEDAPVTKLGLIYNGIDTAQDTSFEVKQTLRHELAISNDTLVLIIVANLISYKGHGDLISALTLIKDQMPSDWQLLIVGQDSGHIREQLQTQAVQFGVHQHIKWLDSRNDIPNLLAISHVGIVASHEESLSNALLEAMAAGIAMIVTDVGGNPEVVQDHKSGLIIPSQNPEAMAAAILKLATDQDLRRTLGLNARQRIAEQFNLDACVDRYDQVYQAIQNFDLPQRNGHLEIKRPFF